MILDTLSNFDYHADHSISKSGLDLMARSPAHYKYSAPREATRAMEIGTAIHTAVLEPHRFQDEYIIIDTEDRRTSVYKECVKVHGSERVLTSKENDKVVGMKEAVLANIHAQRLLTDSDSRKELSVFTKDPETGVMVKCRFDLIVGNKSLDVKKTQDARPEAFAKSVAQYRYHVQAAFYSDVWFWETGEKLEAFGFLAVEEEAPHGTAIYVLDDDALDYGRRLYRRDLNLYAECFDKQEWPGLDGSPSILSLPAWAMKEVA